MSELMVGLTADDRAFIEQTLRYCMANRLSEAVFVDRMRQTYDETEFAAVIAYVQSIAAEVQDSVASLPPATSPEFAPAPAPVSTPTPTPIPTPTPVNTSPKPRPQSLPIPQGHNLDPQSLALKGEEILWLCQQLKAPCEAIGLFDAPRWSEIQIRPNLEAGVRVSKVMELRSDLIVQCGLPRSVILQEAPGHIAIQIPKPQWDEMRLLDAVKPQINQSRAVDRLPLLVGFDSARQPVIDTLDAILVAGTRGGGKTYQQKAIASYLCLTHSPRDAQVVFIDLKRSGFDAFNGSPWNWRKLDAIHDAEQAIDVLQALIDEGDDRQSRFPIGVHDIYGYNARYEPLPKLVLFIDELDKWRKNTDPERADPDNPRSKIVMRGEKRVDVLLTLAIETLRSAGVAMVIGTQHPNNHTLASEIDANLPQRIAFLTAGENESAIALNDKKSTEAAYLLGAGDGIYRFGGQPKIRFQAPLITDDEIRKYVVGWGQKVYGRR